MFEMLACVLFLILFFVIVGIFMRLGEQNKILSGEKEEEERKKKERLKELEKRREEAGAEDGGKWLLFIAIAIVLGTLIMYFLV